MEEDIKILKRTIDLAKRTGMDITLATAIENLLKRYKELEEENNNLKLEKADLYRSRGEYAKAKTIMTSNLRDYIPISVIQNKILNPMKEEHDKAINDFMKKEIPECIAGGEVAQALGCFIGKIEELLEERK